MASDAAEKLGTEERIKILRALQDSGVRAGLSYSAIVARVVTEIRKTRGFSQEELAKRAGVTQSSLSRVEQAETVFNADHAITYAMALDVEPHEIFSIADKAVSWLRERDLDVAARKASAQATILGPGAASLLIGNVVAGEVFNLISKSRKKV